MPIHGTRISRKVKEKFRKVIRNVIDGLSRKVLVYKQSRKSECPNCFYDKFTDSSTGKCRWTPAETLTKQIDYELANSSKTLMYKYFLKGRCPVCHGKGYMEIQRRTWIDALIIWNPSTNAGSNQMSFTPAGTEGSTIVQLKTDPKNFDLLRNCSKLVIDGVDCKISRPPILRGLGVQAILIVTAFTTEKPSIDSEEIIKDYN